ncbi:Epidermal retinol dehydrogenase 2 [Orchesella cincta]|uniref:Epidermal retinol dehydrogenase 2 n=1 Tax=Orchesella cincta TaxID=48709 RepID=A0A1D2MSN7_ORCCI|nr:Epidermal retinol dehydrogenase 2 [Orchesella cincta]
MDQSKYVTLLDLMVLAVCAFYIYLEELVTFLMPRPGKSLDGEIILITGTANGLGKEICKQLIKSKAKLVLWDISEDDNKRTAQDLRDSGAAFVYEDTVDVADRNQVIVAATKVRRHVGNVTILVNNAGIAVMQQFLELTTTSVDQTFRTNVLAHFWTLKEFLPYMLVRNAGHIVTICSTMGQMAMRGPTPYYSTKHAVHGMIECLKDELAHLEYKCEIKFTTVYPFPTITPFLDPSYVATRVIEGICGETEYLYIPETFRIYLAGKFFLPTKLHRLFVDFFVEHSHYSATFRRPCIRNEQPSDDLERTVDIQGKETKVDHVQNLFNSVTTEMIHTTPMER